MSREQRLAYAMDPKTVEQRYIHEIHAEIAEYRLEHSGVLPELARYIEGIGREPWAH